MCTPAATSLASSAFASIEFRPKWDAARCCSRGLCAKNALLHTRHRTLPNWSTFDFRASAESPSGVIFGILGGAGRWIIPRLPTSCDCMSHAVVPPPPDGRPRRRSAHPPPPPDLFFGATPPLGRRMIPGVPLAASSFCGCLTTGLVDCSSRICDMLAEAGGLADAAPPHAGTAGASAGIRTTGTFFSGSFFSFFCFLSLLDASRSVCSAPR